MVEPARENGSWFRSRSGIVLLVFLGIAAYFLLTEHRAHVFGRVAVSLLAGLPVDALPSSWPRRTRPPRRTASSPGRQPMSQQAPAYGLWSLVVINVGIFAMFAYSFVRPRTARDWRSFGALTSFLAALFVEMYAVPLTSYLLSGWLQRRYPGLEVLSHDAGHLWETLLGWQGNPHLNPLHVLSNVLIAGGFIVLARSWPVLYAAQQRGELATTGPYTYVRHPQYAACILIMFGFLLQWPTLLTLVMLSFPTWAYVRLARREEEEVRARFGAVYARYAAVTPAYVPRLRLPAARHTAPR